RPAKPPPAPRRSRRSRRRSVGPSAAPRSTKIARPPRTHANTPLVSRPAGGFLPMQLFGPRPSRGGGGGSGERVELLMEFDLIGQPDPVALEIQPDRAMIRTFAAQSQSRTLAGTLTIGLGVTHGPDRLPERVFNNRETPGKADSFPGLLPIS